MVRAGQLMEAGHLTAAAEELVAALDLARPEVLRWPFIDTPSSLDISRFGGLVTKDLRPKLWGEAFRELAAASPRFRHGEKRVPFVPTEDEMRAYLTGCEGKKRYDTK